MDGDTVLALKGSQKIKIRLANIDAPEKGQGFGSESRQALLKMVLKKQVRVNSRATDSYGRVVAELSIDGSSVNEEQVWRGMAWAAGWSQQSRRAPAGGPLAGEDSHFHRGKNFLALQNEAQRARRGLWVQASPTPPWEWRKAHDAAMDPLRSVTTQGYACGSKQRCAQMLSCDEANFYLIRCGVKSLDGNGDGAPCESLCAHTEWISEIPQEGWSSQAE